MKNESLFIISYFFRIPSSRMILFLLLNTKMWTHAPQWKCRSKSGGESVFSFHLSKDSRDQTQITRIVWVAPSLQNYLTGSGKTAPFFLNYLLLLLLLCTHTCIIWMWEHTCHTMCVGQRTALRNWFFLSPLHGYWRLNPGCQACITRAFTSWVICLAHGKRFLKCKTSQSK